MSKQKLSLVLWLALFLLCSGWCGAAEEEASENESTVTWGFLSDFNSRYVWRGYAYSGGPVIQPSAWVSAYDITLNLWSNIDIQNESDFGHTGRFNEIDISLDYRHSWGKFSIDPTLQFYLYANQIDAPATGEISLKFSYDLGPVTLNTEHSIDMVRYAGSYFGDFGVTFERELLPKLSVGSGAWIGWANGKFNETYGALAKSTPLNVFWWDLELVYEPVEHLSLRPHLQINVILDGDLRRSLIGIQGRQLVVGGLEAGLSF